MVTSLSLEAILLCGLQVCKHWCFTPAAGKPHLPTVFPSRFFVFHCWIAHLSCLVTSSEGDHPKLSSILWGTNIWHTHHPFQPQSQTCQVFVSVSVAPLSRRLEGGRCLSFISAPSPVTHWESLFHGKRKGNMPLRFPLPIFPSGKILRVPNIVTLYMWLLIVCLDASLGWWGRMAPHKYKLSS